ncbi:MAG: ACT domain-containing protein, partial [Marinirhabdus sp.]
KIKWALKKDQKEIASEGKVVLARKLKSLKITLDERTVNQLVSYFKLKTSLDLFYRVGSGIIDNKNLKDFAASRSNALVSFFKNKIRKPDSPEDIDRDEITVKYDQLVFGKEEAKLDYKPANCCNPIPGEDVFGFLTINEGLKVHKQNCPNALQLQSNYSYRIMPAKWVDSTQREFPAEIKIVGIDRMGLVNELTKVVSNNMHIDMKGLHFDSDDGMFNGKITVVVKNKTTLNSLLQKIKKVNGIEKVSRA